MARLTKMFGAAIAAALLLVSVDAVADGMTRTLVPQDGVQYFNPCTQEEMVSFGSVLILTRADVDAAGRLHVNNKVLTHDLGAVGMDSGIRYKAIGRNTSVQQNSTETSGTFTFASRLGWISAGREANWFQTFVFRLRVNANGDATVDDVRTFFDCR